MLKLPPLTVPSRFQPIDYTPSIARFAKHKFIALGSVVHSISVTIEFAPKGRTEDGRSVTYSKLTICEQHVSAEAISCPVGEISRMVARRFSSFNSDSSKHHNYLDLSVRFNISVFSEYRMTPDEAKKYSDISGFSAPIVIGWDKPLKAISGRISCKTL